MMHVLINLGAIKNPKRALIFPIAILAYICFLIRIERLPVNPVAYKFTGPRIA